MSPLINGIEISEKNLKDYYSKQIKQIYKILLIWESCDKKDDFSDYLIYVDNTLIKLVGAYNIIGDELFLTLSTTLSGLSNIQKLNHKIVKSLVLECTNSIGRKSKEEVE